MVTKKIKVVFDANIYLSFLLTRGETITTIFRSWLDGVFDVYASPEIISEVRAASNYPKLQKRITQKDKEVISALFHYQVERVYPTKTVSFPKDPDDAIYLAAARACDADYLVTGDTKHLLPLKKFGRTKIVTPAEFKQIVSK